MPNAIIAILGEDTLHELEPEALRLLSDIFGKLSDHFLAAHASHPAVQNAAPKKPGS